MGMAYIVAMPIYVLAFIDANGRFYATSYTRRRSLA